MKKFIAVLATFSVCGFVSAATAADMPVKAAPLMPAPAMFSWNGFYVGLNGGYAWSANDHLLSFTTVGTFGGLNPEGFFGGGQIGYNWQFGGPLVLGIEADIQGGHINDSGISSGGRGTAYDLNWFGTVRGRAGYAIDRSLFYVTGGFAYGDLNKRTFAGVPTDFTFNGTATGYVLGGGWEYAFAPNWSAKLEYQYLNLGHHDMVDPTGVNYATTRDLNNPNDAFHTIRLGINYRFGGVRF